MSVTIGSTPSSPWLLLVTTTCNALDQLLQILLHEQNLLTHNQIDQLAGVSLRKQQAANEAEAAGEQLQLALQHAGVTPGTDVTVWFEQHAPEALETWQLLRETARQAELYNRSNGLLIETRRQLLDQFVSQLASARGDALSYSAKGRLTAGGSGSLSRDKI
ncbi:FlgN protein [Andreprevotia lacus DSM 23236]|uniref:FlgN protein n=1 Tax=Andreprevotia lacus DSM 23236 TaxID=1121001 RepID=A0A1W1X9G6_9NEIS|nr:flagellar export chaperone FlgN [Andreprevotia lacus]SMC20556.1 FlgN protein [Andreprevotia lacus DSM 23236]